MMMGMMMNLIMSSTMSIIDNEAVQYVLMVQDNDEHL
jgi:hypothetical protein